MNVLLLGSGGREHAIAIALAKSRRLRELFVAPGNPGMLSLGRAVALDVTDHSAVANFCKLMAIDLVVVGPEAPLVAGIVDDLAVAGIKAFGPSKAAAQLEGSKGFTKEFCARYKIPTAAYALFSDAASATAYVREKGAPIVIKADGLASGKGVVVAMSLDEAEAAIEAMFAGGFGQAGPAGGQRTIVVEEFLEGEEASFFALCDGARAVAFASAQDHKRLGEGERGPNTGGMGAYSPAPVMDAPMSLRVMREIIEPTLQGMAEMGMPFKGVLFAGLMIGEAGPKLIEFNVRFGDPETQVMLPRLEEDLLALMLACVEGNLPQPPLRLSPLTALSVVLAAKGYPEAPQKGSEILGLARAQAMPFVTITHAGTKVEGTRLLANGGRVLNVTGLGADVVEARARAYAAIDAIDWPQGFCRRDIGWRALQRL
ncbi:phosphoribosylamine--glycine ligase [Methylocapsa aurea]|uniref:phosphoribosylamine--glycine ligase n=1 Tax=Methylocapsa aurea TaxID=663610 RepID=UPI00055C5B6A|nr:phosphoribosylamine--glycine ligase [Methylocapsa aurea]